MKKEHLKSFPCDKQEKRIGHVMRHNNHMIIILKGRKNGKEEKEDEGNSVCSK